MKIGILTALWQRVAGALEHSRRHLMAAPVLAVVLIPLVFNWAWASRAGWPGLAWRPSRYCIMPTAIQELQIPMNSIFSWLTSHAGFTCTGFP